MIKFVDKFTTCSLKNPRCKHIVESVNQHAHTHTCRKHTTTCRFRFPRFPSINTEIGIPSYIKYKDPERASEELIKAQMILRDVKEVLENKELMENLVKTRKSDIDTYMYHTNIYQKIEDYLKEVELKISIHKRSKDKCIIEEYNKHWNETITDQGHWDIEKLHALKEIHEEKASQINLLQCRKDRLYEVLKEAKIEGKNFEECNEKYTKALQITSHGYSVILKRDIDELNINNYNEEWIICWDGNMDIVFCMDFFGIITYITDYYMKDESGTLKLIEEALKQSDDDPIKSKLKLVKNTFLTHRQVGESEAYYKLFPFLHLSYSNIGTQFVLTGFPKNRSRYLKQIEKEMKDNFENVIEVEGKEGKFYVEKQSFMEKYEDCPNLLKETFKLSNLQFMKRYDSCKTGPKEYDIKKEMSKELTLTDIKKKNYIIYKIEPEFGETGRFLPTYIRLEGKSKSSEHPWMKLRGPRVLRFYKIKQKTNPHEYYYSEMQKYLPFRNEKQELYPDDFDRCKEKYMKNKDLIDFAKLELMPFLESVEEGRERAEEILESDIGSVLDPTKEQADEEDETEGTHEHPELFLSDPGGLLKDMELGQRKDNVFRKIELDSNENILQKIRSLDPDQKLAVGICVNYAKNFVKATRRANPRPTAPLIIMHGGAGTGKSTVVDSLTQIIEKIFRKPGDSPNHPYVLKTAFTGNAAFIIKGQTLNSAFNFGFGNEVLPLSDKIRDHRRKLLQNLRMIIIDEISLVRSDMLYQIHFRLAKDIFQNELPFGGVALVVCGDIMQIRPTKNLHLLPHSTNEPSSTIKLKICGIFLLL